MTHEEPQSLKDRDSGCWHAIRSRVFRGLAQTSPFEVCVFPKGPVEVNGLTQSVHAED